MKSVTVLLLALGLLAAPAFADHVHRHHAHDFEASRFSVEDDVLVITHDGRRSHDRVVVAANGDLTVNGERIATSSRERKMLQRFHEESLKLEEMADAIAEDAGVIAAQSVSAATRAVATAFRALARGDGDALDDFEADFEDDFEADLDDHIAAIEAMGDEIEDQADEVIDLAEELQDRIPELAALRWFLDD